MDDEKLIELVREKTVLYDSSHPKYMDPKLKILIWKSIGTEMNMTGIQCKNRWTNIRDHFRRHMQKRKIKTEQAVHNCKRYKYEDQLQFLLPHSSDKDTLTRVPYPQEPVETETNQSHASSSVAERTFRSSNSVRRSQKTTASPATPSALLMQYILETNDPVKVTQIPPDPIDTFLAGIASTLKKLSPYNQHIARERIFTVVHELESQELFSKPPYDSSVSSQHSQQNSD